MIKSVFILSALLSQSIFFLNHHVDEVFGGNAVPSQTQNCAQDADNGDYRYEISSDLNNPTILNFMFTIKPCQMAGFLFRML
jgi:hypothetical protein